MKNRRVPFIVHLRLQGLTLRNLMVYLVLPAACLVGVRVAGARLWDTGFASGSMPGAWWLATLPVALIGWRLCRR